MSKNHALPKPRRASRPSGFTLIEVLVALTIAAMGLGALMAAAGQGLGNVSAADHFVEATRRAQSRIAIVGVNPAGVAGETSGDDGGGYFWRVAIQPITVRAAQPKTDPNPLGIYNVTVVVSWREKSQTKSVSVQTQRVWPASGPHS